MSDEADSLHEVLSVEPVAPGVYRWMHRPGWLQGRGAFGGVVMGALARAIEASEPETDRVLRQLAGAITGPVQVGEAELRVEPLRRGNAVSTWEASLRQGGELLARAVAVLGRRRADDRRWAPPAPPEITHWSTLPAPVQRGPMAPEFTQHFEFRPVSGFPFTGGGPEAAAVEGWIRARRPPPVLGAPEVIAYADCWYPASFVMDELPRPSATIGFTLEYLPPPAPLSSEAPLRHRARAVAAAEGYVTELRELWTEDGRLVALNQQTFVVIK